ncbi:MAG TPA: hypothetical protein VGH11_07645 [Jatrophihabitans sp.]|jgi:hypothetical protein
MPSVEQRLFELIAAGQGDIAVPGRGSTLSRWQTLARVASEDLALVKLFEGHTDAIAILDELGSTWLGSTGVWGTWAAEPPQAKLRLHRRGDRVRLSGRKAWCSGADIVTHSLVTCWDEQDRQCLAAVDMTDPGVMVTKQGWNAIGMGLVASPDVLFDDAEAVTVGLADDYVTRPGFWHGGCGIAACWYGGALPLAQALVEAVQRRAEPHAEAHLGAVDVALRSLRALLIEGATWIDENPHESAQGLALRLRAAADETATLVHTRVGRGLGAGPLCRDPDIAQRFADLPVFIRQTHAERDLAELGRLVARGSGGWSL